MIAEPIDAVIVAAWVPAEAASTLLVAVPLTTYREHGISLTVTVSPGLKPVKFVVTFNKSYGDMSIGSANSSLYTISVSDTDTIFF